MKRNQVSHIRYKKTTNYGRGQAGEVTDRYIIPTSIPSDNVQALDVTGRSDEETQRLQQLWEQYVDYYQTQLSTIFSFEQWLEHTTEPTDSALATDIVKWRKFKWPNVEELDD